LFENVKNDCGENSATLLIENVEYCSTLQECFATLKSVSPCNNNRKNNNLSFWFLFNNIKIDNQITNLTSFKGMVSNVQKKGNFNFDLDNTQFSISDGNIKSVKLNSGSIKISDISNNYLTATYSLNVTINKVDYSISGKLYKIKIDQ
jgi:hypothetical protein